MQRNLRREVTNIKIMQAIQISMNEIWKRRNKQFQLNKKINYPPIICKILEMVLKTNKQITNQSTLMAKIRQLKATVWNHTNRHMTQIKIMFHIIKIKKPLHNIETIFKYWFLTKLDTIIACLSGKIKVIKLRKIHKLIQKSTKIQIKRKAQLKN